MIDWLDYFVYVDSDANCYGKHVVYDVHSVSIVCILRKKTIFFDLLTEREKILVVHCQTPTIQCQRLKFIALASHRRSKKKLKT